MSSGGGRRSLRKPQAPVRLQLCDYVNTETCIKDEETSNSEEDVSDLQKGEFFKIVVKEEPEDDDYPCGESSRSIFLLDEQTGEFQKMVVEEEPEFQDYLYCEECGSSFINECEVHGPPRFIADTPIPMGVSDRARRTLPPGLEIRESGIPNAGLGVFNVGETVPVGVHFGPYEGDLVDRDEAMKSGYSWVIYKNGHREEYIDAKRELNANWMRFVNCARNDEENNLVASQYQGGILYRCCRTIQPGQELLVWFDEEYAKDLGTTFSYLWKKKRSANVEKAHSCSECGKSFTQLSNLQTHQRVHTGEKPYHCSVCGKSFTQKSNLQTHERIHSGEKPYQCLECGRGFTVRSSLLKHERVHSGERPYHCKECGRSFTDQSSFRRHERIHSGERPYECSQCGKNFTDRSSLLKHQRNHSGEKPWPCSQCGRSFADQSSLKTHQRIHSGEKPYQCALCGKSFAQKSNLHIHQRSHSGEKPYECPQCGKCFIHQGHLKRHQDIHRRQ